MSKRLAIVTGAPGWLGSRLVETLVGGLEGFAELSSICSGRDIRVLNQPGSDIASLAASVKGSGSAVSFVDCDVSDESMVKKAFEDARDSVVFHCAGVIHPSRGTKEFYDVNVNGTKNVLESAIESGAKRFVHVSSNSPCGTNSKPGELFDESSAYNPYMHYGKSKKLGEDLVNNAHAAGRIETVIIRPPWFYGPGQPPRQSLFFTMIKRGSAPIVGTGENLRSMAYVDNICQGLMLCEVKEEANGRTYWIADRRPYTMNEVVDTIERLLETEFSMEVAHKRMRLPGFASEVAYAIDASVQGLGLYHQKIHVLSEMNKNIACSVSRAASELGYDPRIELEEGMRRSIRWVLDQGRTI